MKCVLRETKEFECFYLSEYNVEEFVEWLNKNSNCEYEYINSYKNYISVYCDNVSFDYDINRWYVWKYEVLYDYDEDIFNKIYRRI